MENNELLSAIRQMIKEENAPINQRLDAMQSDIAGLKTGLSSLKTDVADLKRGQTKLAAELKGTKAEMHERFDKLESITEYSLKQIDYLDQAYKAL